MTRSTEVRTFLVRLFCDGCKNVEMIYEGQTFSTPPAPVTHVHRCPDCSAVQLVERPYPYINYVSFTVKAQV